MQKSASVQMHIPASMQMHIRASVQMYIQHTSKRANACTSVRVNARMKITALPNLVTTHIHPYDCPFPPAILPMHIFKSLV